MLFLGLSLIYEEIKFYLDGTLLVLLKRISKL